MSLYFAAQAQTNGYSRIGNILMLRFVGADENPTQPPHGLAAPPAVRLSLHEHNTDSLNQLMSWTNPIFEQLIPEAHDIIARAGREEIGELDRYHSAWRLLDLPSVASLTFSLLPGDMEPISTPEEERIREMMRPDEL
jgi:hypothetical protein